LVAVVFAGGHISGAHYNPAVTIAVFLRGKCPASDVVPYIAAQIVAAVLAALVVINCTDTPTAAPRAKLELVPVFLVEFLFTFALAWVVLNVATAKGTTGNSFYGLAIGFTVMAGAFAVGSISGGVFNPAVAVGISVLKFVAWKYIWVYFLANFAGGVAAAFVFRATNPPEGW
jgi:aquaporin Z